MRRTVFYKRRRDDRYNRREYVGEMFGLPNPGTADDVCAALRLTWDEDEYVEVAYFNLETPDGLTDSPER